MKEYYFQNRIYYRTNEFKINRKTLVFVHGLSGSSSAWLPYEKIFEDKYNILTFDIRGHGKSKKFPNYSDYEIKKFAEDLFDLTSYLKIEKFILISHSFSTLIALEYLVHFRESVIASIFLSPIIYMNMNLSSKLIRPIVVLSKIFPFSPKPRGQIDYSKHKNTGDWNIKRCYADLKNTTLRVYLHCLRQSLIKKQEYFLEKIQIPTLIVHGNKDTMAPVKNSIIMSKKIENSKLVIIPNTNHIVVLNNVNEVSREIENFISGIK
jgi:pimeloyl-ACP methyl ester carboxylesterase